MNGEVSPAALAANRRLQAMRQQLARARAAGGDPAGEEARHSRCAPEPLEAPWGEQGGRENGSHSHLTIATPHSIATNVAPSIRPTDRALDLPLRERITSLPPHLGWGNETLTKHLRKLRITNYELRIQSGGAGEQGSREAEEQREGRTAPTAHCPLPTIHSLPNSSLVTRHSSLVKIYPTLALAMLRQEQAAAGRVWLLLRHLDDAGRGCVALDEARAALCARDAPLRLCGWRRLRQLLAQGEGVFWTRDDRGRVWLHGPARVAAALGVARLVGRPVGVPVAALLGGIGDARAHLYATFHTGRVRENWQVLAGERGSRGEREQGRKGAGEKGSEGAGSSLSTPASSGSPISRDTLAELSGVCARSQTSYERRAGVTAKANIALGERVAADGAAGPAEQERAWRQGRAMFRLKDYRGQHGRPGAVYLAWRLPNGYGPARGHQQRPKGRQKRINRQLADLFTKGMTGNGERIEKRFYGSAAAAVKAQGSGGAGERGRSGARSSLVTRHSKLVTRHWPLRAGRGGWRVWATLEPAAGPGRPSAPVKATRNPGQTAGAVQTSFFGGQGGRKLRGL